jgi:hypothetical protein
MLNLKNFAMVIVCLWQNGNNSTARKNISTIFFKFYFASLRFWLQVQKFHKDDQKNILKSFRWRRFFASFLEDERLVLSDRCSQNYVEIHQSEHLLIRRWLSILRELFAVFLKLLLVLGDGQVVGEWSSSESQCKDRILFVASFTRALDAVGFEELFLPKIEWSVRKCAAVGRG